MTYNLLRILLFFSVTISVYPQNTISGKIYNKQDGETLFGVNIIIQGQNIGAVTNEYGFYSLSVPTGNYSIIYSYLGFKTLKREIEVVEDISISIELEEDVTLLDEVIISEAEGQARSKISKPQMSVNSLSVNTIKKAPVVFGEVDILKTIVLLPGVTNAGEGSSGFNVRGGAVDQNLVLLDEATIYNTSHLFGFFSVFNADAIKDIKLYKGGIPSKYGGRVSSVLDVRQKDGNNQNFHLNGGIGLISSRLMAEGPIKKEKSSFLVAARTSYVNLFLKLADKKNRLSFYDINTKFSFELNKNNKLFLSGYLGEDNFNIFDEVANENETADQTEEEPGSIDTNYGNTSVNLRWNHLFNSKLFSNLSLIYTKYDYDLTFRPNGFFWISDIVNYNAKYDFNYYFKNSLKFNFGINLHKYTFNPGKISPIPGGSIIQTQFDKKQALEPAAYVDVEQKISNKLNVRYGFRLSSFIRTGEQKLSTYLDDNPILYNSDFGIYESADTNGEVTYKKGETIKSFVGLEPRLSMSYKLNDKSSVKASFQRINQFLHLISNTDSATPLDVWAPSGKYIKPQISNQFALGYFKNFNNEKYSLEIESYYKTVANRVDYVDGANIIATNTIETEILQGEARAYGIEFLLQKNIGKLKGWLSYTLSKSEQRVQGRNTSEPGINNGNWYNTVYDRTHDLSLTGSYYLNEKWSIGANFVFQTGRPTNYPSGGYIFDDYTVPVYDGARNEERLPAYHRFDISATLTPRKNTDRKWKGNWVFGIYNLYGRKNAASINFRANSEGKTQANRTSIFGFMPAITYNFKF